MAPWRAWCLCLLLGLLLVSAVRDDDGAPKLNLALDGEAVQAFVSQFGAAQKMTARQIEVSYDSKYIPKRHGPDFGVPKVVTAGLKYKPWTDSMYCSYYGCFQPTPNPAPYFPTIYDWASNNPDQKISTQVMELIGVEVFKGPFTGTLFLPTDSAWSAYLARWKVPIVNTTRAEQFYANFFIRLLQYHTLLLRVYGSQLDGFKYSTVYANINAYPHKVTFGQSKCSGGTCGGGCSGCNSGCTAGCNNNTGCSTCNGWYGNGGWQYTKHGKRTYHFYSPGPYKKYHYKGYYPPCSSGCTNTPPCSGSGCVQQPPCSGSGCSSGCSGSGCSGGCSGCSGGCSGCSGGCSSCGSSSCSSCTSGCSGCSGGCSSCSGGCSSCSGGCSSCGAPANFLIDEQNNVVTFNSIDKFVYGGGVIHTLNMVLEPMDIFPSLTAAINSSDIFSDLRIALDRINNEGNFSMLPTLEEIPGTMAVPTNEAFQSAGVDVNTYPVDGLLNVVAYHFCAFTKAYRLLYYPFKGKPGKNPCLTILSRAYQISYGLAWNATKPGITKTPDMWINYATGVYPDGLKVKRANIVTADLTMPVHSAHVIRDLIIPPTNMTATRVMTATVRTQVTATLSSASLTAKLSQESKWSKGIRRKRRSEKKSAQHQQQQGQQATELDLDADEDDADAKTLKSPLQLMRGIADMQLIGGSR